MRESLMKTFDDIYILDLHGNSKKKEKNPADGSADQNVFDITEGVSIGIFVKKPASRALPTDVRKSSAFPKGDDKSVAAAPPEQRHSRKNEADGEAELRRTSGDKAANVYHHDLYGVREVFDRTDGEKKIIGGKYKYLRENDLTTTEWTELEPQSPFYLFVKQNVQLRAEYEQYWTITSVFPFNNVGLVTSRDSLTIHYTADSILNTVKEFSALPVEEARSRFNLGKDALDWTVSLAQEDLNKSAGGITKDLVTSVLYRPFDRRFTYYTGTASGFHCRPRADVMREFAFQDNLGLAVGRAGQVVGDIDWDLLFVSNSITEFNLFRRGGNSLFPLYLYPKRKEGLFDETNNERRANISP